MAQFHKGEFLIFQRVLTDPKFWSEWNQHDSLFLCFFSQDSAQTPSYVASSSSSVGHDSLMNKVFSGVFARYENLERFVSFMKKHREIEQARRGQVRKESYLSTYLNTHQFTELHLDSIFKPGDNVYLPVELFKCRSVKYLSLKGNSLERISPDVGRMSELEHLALTSNRLQIYSLPFTMTFCTKLRVLQLDYNLLDALPGFLLNMPSLESIHRHGNHNYFKATFMWYHTDVTGRILPVSPGNFSPTEPETLQFWAAKAIIGRKENFFVDPEVADTLKNYISIIYPLFNVCANCDQAVLQFKTGYKVITFKNPHLGNTCVPFQHWACSHDCAESIESPARQDQIRTAKELDMKYAAYIAECQRQYQGQGHRLPSLDVPQVGTTKCACVIA